MAQVSIQLGKKKKRSTPRTKTGCITCRERRIKCDETKPNCKRCVGAGRLCRGVGYNVTPRPLDASAVVAAPVAIGSLPLLAPRISSTAKATELIHLVPHVSDISSSRSPAEELSQYTLSQFHSLTLYVEFLPSRMGCNIALDSAIDAIICALRDLCRSSKKTSVATLTAYAQALVDLQDMIEDLVECLSAETLCATQLLGYFEALTRPDGQISNNHAQGTLQLIQFRGPERFRNGFERALLMSQATVLNADATFTGQAAFLHDEKWMSLLKSDGVTLPTMFDEMDWRSFKFEVFLPLPKLLEGCTKLLMVPGLDTDQDYVTSLLEQVDAVRLRLKNLYAAWHKRFHPLCVEECPVEYEIGNTTVDEGRFLLQLQLNFMLYNRIRIAIDGEGALELEHMAKNIATSVTLNPLLQSKVSVYHDRHICGTLSYSILTTSDTWCEAIRAWEKSKDKGRSPVTKELWFYAIHLTGLSSAGG